MCVRVCVYMLKKRGFPGKGGRKSDFSMEIKGSVRNSIFRDRCGNQSLSFTHTYCTVWLHKQSVQVLPR